MAVDENQPMKWNQQRAALIDSIAKSAQPACYIVSPNGRYLASYEVSPSGMDHALVKWKMTKEKSDAIVFCSEKGAKIVAELFNEYLRPDDPKEHLRVIAKDQGDTRTGKL